MGYTHCWYQPLAPIAPEVWAKIAADVRLILQSTAVPVRREYDTPDILPEVSDDLICFNGVGKGGHETFYFERAPAQPDYRAKEKEFFAFCKTAHKPYDEVVTACLTVIAHHAPDIRVSSDGDPGDWTLGKMLADKATGRTHSIKLGG